MASHGLIPGSLALAPACSLRLVTFEQSCLLHQNGSEAKSTVTPVQIRRAMPSTV